jgi:hypothetical protein
VGGWPFIGGGWWCLWAVVVRGWAVVVCRWAVIIRCWSFRVMLDIGGGWWCGWSLVMEVSMVGYGCSLCGVFCCRSWVGVIAGHGCCSWWALMFMGFVGGRSSIVVVRVWAIIVVPHRGVLGTGAFVVEKVAVNVAHPSGCATSAVWCWSRMLVVVLAVVMVSIIGVVVGCCVVMVVVGSMLMVVVEIEV